jgi:HEAT repeat protein
VSETLPSIVRALQDRNINVQLGSALVLFGIGRRPDGAQLLAGYYPSILQMLDSADDRLQITPIFLIGELRPPPPEAVPVLLRFVEQPARDSKAQSGAIGLLVRLAPQSPQVIAQIKAYLSKPSDPNDRVLALSAVRGLRTDDEQLIAVVVKSLEDSNSGVRFTAVQVVLAMGPNALRQAEPALRKMVANPEETPETQAMAKRALEQVGSQ